MRRVIKNHNSIIISSELSYKEGNSHNNLKISEILYSEQKGFCAYTEEYIGRADAKDIEHFNPELKGTPHDNYNNWFLVKHQWNKEKSQKWNDTILYPTADDFENRIIYDNGDYRVADDNDDEARNLITLLKLDDLLLADERKKYIRRKLDEKDKFGVDAEIFFEILITDDIKQISYIRAIQEEFKINIWDMLPQPKINI